MTVLTSKQRATLDAAMAIISSMTPLNASWAIYSSNYHGEVSSSVTYFTSAGEQHSWVGGETLADKVETVAAIEASAERDEVWLKARRVKKLREELAALEGTAA